MGGGGEKIEELKIKVEELPESRRKRRRDRAYETKGKKSLGAPVGSHLAVLAPVQPGHVRELIHGAILDQ